jgi:hypothetical protein
MTHHLGGAGAFREALIRAVVMAALIILGAAVSAMPRQCTAPAAHAPAAHATTVGTG